jgi:hypothetical protein
MWLMTKYGFFSVVCAWKDETDKTPHPDLMMIRARCRSHLENLQKRFKVLEGHTITETQNTDYPYRLLAPRADMAGVVSGLLEEIDYCNFKSEVHDTLPDDDSYQDFLLNVWSEGLGMQDG